ncbi:MAG TPA: PAS domain S-box protein [Gemmatimonadaceae bacterium]|nr:PAS domain S-box protein [Gemmatimonadaceae bacterium]
MKPTPTVDTLVLADVFRIAFEHSAAGISVATPSGEYLHANRAFCEFVGYSLDELRRMNLMDLVHPDDRRRTAELTSRMASGHLAEARWERRYVHKSGLPLWALLTTTLVRDDQAKPAYLVSQVIDISDRKLADEALQRAEARSRALIGAMQDVILVVDRDGRYMDVAPTAQDRLVRPADELLGRRIHEVFPRERADAFMAAVGRALETRQPVELAYDLEIRGERYFFESSYSPLPEDRVVIVARDVSARRRAEQALRESEDQLRQAQKMEAVGQLAGGIAHDFNNLLMAIMSNAELAALELSADAPQSAASQHIEEIKHASRRARSLTQQLLAFSRKQMLQPRVIDLNTVVRDSEQILRRLIGENITMTAALDQDLGAVRADPGQITQVLMNLAVNARDAMPSGGELFVETTNRDIAPRDARDHRGLKEGHYVAIEVRDTGIGMDEQTMSRIFEPFFTTKPPGEGTGLGLSTVYGIVKQSGGYTAVDSTMGTGTTFTILLPRVHEASETGHARAPAAQPTLSRGTILLVEDESAVREATKRMLRKYGFDVLEAKHGEDALILWETEALRVDVVLTDVVMPLMGGVDLVRALRRTSPHLRVVFMSGYTQGTLELSSMDEHATRFLPKPFTADQLVGTLRELLNGDEPSPR